MSKVAVIVLTHNHVDITNQCIQALLKSSVIEDIYIVRVDNDSEPPFVSYTSVYADNIKDLRNNENLPFSKANNLAVSSLNVEYILLLNNDCFVRPDTVEKMLQVMKEHPEVGVVGPKLLYTNNTVQSCGTVFIDGKHPAHRFVRSQENDQFVNMGGYVPCITGACLLTRKSIWEMLGGLCEDYVPYAFEDVDYCLRVREAGYRIWYEPGAVATHLESYTSFYDEAHRVERRNADMATYKVYCQKWLNGKYYGVDLNIIP